MEHALAGMIFLICAVLYMIGCGVALVMLVRWRNKQDVPWGETDPIGIAAASAIWPIVLVWLLFESRRPRKQEV
jgi:hypothetical protein